MSKSILISIKAEHTLNILNGNKTLELRKSVPKDFKGWVYVYVTKRKPYIEYVEHDGEKYYHVEVRNVTDWNINGKVVARFWFDEYEELFFIDSEDDYKLTYDFGIYYDYDEEIFTKLCLTKLQVYNYGNGKNLYAWYIKNLEIFDKTKELKDFVVWNKGDKWNIEDNWTTLTKAPQSWQYVWAKEELE